MNEAYALRKGMIGIADMKKELYGMRMPYHYSSKPQHYIRFETTDCQWNAILILSSPWSRNQKHGQVFV